MIGKEWQFCPLCGSSLIQGSFSRCPSCSFVHWKNPVPGVVLVLWDHERRILLGRRSPGQFLEGRWCLPGGHLEVGEDYRGAATREAYEETGLSIEPSGLLAAYSNRFADGKETLVVEAMVPPGSLPPPRDDLDSLVWGVPNGPLPPLAFEADRDAIHRWAGGLVAAGLSPVFFSTMRSE